MKEAKATLAWYLADAGQSSLEKRLAVGGKAPSVQGRKKRMQACLENIEKDLDQPKSNGVEAEAALLVPQPNEESMTK